MSKCMPKCILCFVYCLTYMTDQPETKLILRHTWYMLDFFGKVGKVDFGYMVVPIHSF